MNQSRLRFSILTQVYALLFVGGMLGAPLLYLMAISRHHPVSDMAWTKAAAISVFVAALFVYANSRCSGEKLTYREGMLFVTSFTMTGWLYFSFFFVMPALFATFIVSVVLAIYFDLTRRPNKAAQFFHRWVAAMYRYRVRQ